MLSSHGRWSAGNSHVQSSTYQSLRRSAAPVLTRRESLAIPVFYQVHGPTGSSRRLNLVYAVVLRGPVDAAAMEAAVGRIFDEQPALRAYFSAEGKPLEKFHSDEEPPFAFVDAEGVGSMFKQAVRDALAREFDFRTYPLMHVTLVRRSEDRHVFVLTAHHLLLDSWSVAVLLRTLSKYYEGPDASRVRIGMNDSLGLARYVEEQSAYLASPAFAQSLETLVTTLAPAIDCLRPRKLVVFPSATEVHTLVRFDGVHARRLREAHGSTVTEAHALIFAVLIHWLTRAGEIGFSQAHPNRPENAIGLLGFLSNDHLLKVSITPESTIAELVRSLAQARAFAEEHRGVPSGVLLGRLYGSLLPLPRFHFNPIGTSVNALRLKDVRATHLQGIQSFAQTELNLISLSSTQAFLALAEPTIEGRTLGDLERVVHVLIARLAQPDATIGSVIAGL